MVKKRKNELLGNLDGQKDGRRDKVNDRGDSLLKLVETIKFS